MRILLTNDDGHTSPLLQFIADKLSTIGELTIVVPKYEQSWTGKSISRFKQLHKGMERIGSFDAYTIDGTPGDCVNIALHHICEGGKPDLVVSGINAGINAGAGFIFSSGTVGACFEANISGVPAIALSQHFDPRSMCRWIATNTFPVDELERLRKQSTDLLDKIFAYYFSQDWKRSATFNFNLPFKANQPTQIINAPVSHIMYGSCFKQVGDHFEHNLSELTDDDRPITDSKVVFSGDISVSELDIKKFGQLS